MPRSGLIIVSMVSRDVGVSGGIQLVGSVEDIYTSFFSEECYIYPQPISRPDQTLSTHIQPEQERCVGT